MRVTGSEIRLLRMLNNVDQRSVAKMVGKSQQYISRLESYGNRELSDYWTAELLTVFNCNEIEIKKIRELLHPPPPHSQIT